MKPPWRRGPSKLDRVLAAAQLDEALGRIEPAIPAKIYNRNGGTRSHYQDPDSADLKPVCKASGSRWAKGSGGLKLCGLCPHMWGQRQGGSEEKAAAS